jgi:hypothetical protein
MTLPLQSPARLLIPAQDRRGISLALSRRQMPRNGELRIRARLCVVGFLTVGSCADPFGFDAQPTPAEESCPASVEWLPTTPPLQMFKPLPHPETECPFYRGAWQNFLIATQPDATGEPALLRYPTIDVVFDSAKPLPAQRALLGDIRQAGQRHILIDQNGNSIYYGIHVNQAYADFIAAHGLRTKDAIQNADRALFFPPGVVELKSAWQIVDDSTATDDFITATATVATLKAQNNQIVEDRNTPRTVKVRLLALHVAFTLPGHPEFIWATFEHTSGTPDSSATDGKRDVAPIHPKDVNPDPSDPSDLNDQTVISDRDFLLYKRGTTAQAANQAIAEADLQLDEATQKFPGQQTSIFRMFPASKSNTTTPDAAITSLNRNVEALFSQATSQGILDAADKRGHYRLVGAQWMDKPQYFAVDMPIQNDESSPFAGEPGFLKDLQDNGSDSDYSILAGEDRLSSTAIESFTQAPDSFPNCFTCHNTQAVTANGVPVNRDGNGVRLLDPKLLNVSHVLSQFVLEETQ